MRTRRGQMQEECQRGGLGIGRVVLGEGCRITGQRYDRLGTLPDRYTNRRIDAFLRQSSQTP